MTEVDVSPVRLMHFTVGWPVAVRGQRQVTLRGRPSPWPEQSITQHRHFSFPSGHSLSACYSSGDTAMLSFLLYPTKSVTPISVSGALLFFFFFGHALESCFLCCDLCPPRVREKRLPICAPTPHRWQLCAAGHRYRVSGTNRIAQRILTDLLSSRSFLVSLHISQLTSPHWPPMVFTSTLFMEGRSNPKVTGKLYIDFPALRGNCRLFSVFVEGTILYVLEHLNFKIGLSKSVPGLFLITA